MNAIGRLCTALLTGVVSFGTAAVANGEPEGLSRMKLDNGVTVLLFPIDGVFNVAVEALYPVGFLHEPPAMTQAAHLLERLACHGPTKSYGPDESFSLLNEIGMTRSETFPDWTYYNYVLEPGDLELALKIEAERLVSLSISEAAVSKEAKKCYDEATSAKGNRKLGMLKQAFMVLSHAWRHGAKSATVRRGLERIPMNRLESFRRSWYRPENLVLVIAGDFKRTRAMELVEKYIGSIEAVGERASAVTDWSKVAKNSTVTWDVNLHALCITFPPARDPIDNLMLSIWGSFLLERLTTDPEIREVAQTIYCSNMKWPIGTMPFFLYAEAKTSADLPLLEEQLRAGLSAAISEKPAWPGGEALDKMLSELSRAPVVSKEAFHRQSLFEGARFGRDITYGESIVLGNLGLQWGVWNMRGFTESAAIALSRGDAARRLRQAVERNVDVAKIRVTILKPEHED